jgi:hypothetical protein
LQLCAGMGLLILSLGACRVLGDGHSWEDDGRGAGGYYVSPEGDEEADGRSADTAFGTIERALEVAQPGDTVQILLYHEALVVEGVGDSDWRITIQGVESGAIKDGLEDLAIGLWDEGCTDMIVENLEMRNCTDIG